MSRAIHALEALLLEWSAEREQAALHYELWRLQPDPARSRRHAAAAVELYHRLYHRTHWIDDRRRCEELSGEALPELLPLPAPPPIVTADPVDLAVLLVQVDQITAELKA
jgi:hypothetical protein